MTYEILTPDVLEKLKDCEWFKRAISLEYRDIAKSYGCVVVMSSERLLQAHDIFLDDLDNGIKRHLPDGTTSLNQFKMSAYLTFWLRRMNPIRDIKPNMSLGDRLTWVNSGSRLSKDAEEFMLLGNEIAALHIGMRLSLYFSIIGQNRNGVGQIHQERLAEMNLIDGETIVEFAKILKYKNISSHGLNMVFQMMCGDGRRKVNLGTTGTL